MGADSTSYHFGKSVLAAVGIALLSLLLPPA